MIEDWQRGDWDNSLEAASKNVLTSERLERDLKSLMSSGLPKPTTIVFTRLPLMYQEDLPEWPDRESIPWWERWAAKIRCWIRKVKAWTS